MNVESRDEKKYYIFQEGSDLMFVMNIPPENLDDAMIKSFLNEARSRGLESIIDPNIESLIKDAKQGEVVRIGGAHIVEAQKAADEAKRKEEEVKEEEVDLDSLPFELEVSPDSMQAHLSIMDVSGSLSRKSIDAALEHSGIKNGLIEENIEKAIEDWPKIFKVLIAEGTLAEDGTDGELHLAKQYKDNLAPEISEEGHVDFKHLNLIEPIEPGEVLQRRTPPTPGVSGSNIFGQPVKANSGKDVKLKKGKNTEVDENGLNLVSSVEGFLHIDSRGMITVRPVYVVEGDVDYSTGIIEYKQDVLVKGDVLAGFAVIAGGDIQIRGAVEDCTLEAGGNIIINGGVVSSGRAIIKADGDIQVGFVKHATIEAGGSVYIKRESVGSRIKAAGDIEVLRSDGRIIGGELVTGGWITAPIMGSEVGPLLLLRFEGKRGVSSTDNRFEFSFVSTKSLASPVEVRFGPMMTKVSIINSAVSVSIKENRIVVENFYIGPEELNMRRRLRDRAAKEPEQTAKAADSRKALKRR